MASRPSLTAQEIEQQLDNFLDVEFSFLKTAGPATILAELERQEQEYIISWVQRVASTNIQLAYQFITQAVDALDSMDKRIIEAWALHAMDTYDQTGLYKALEVIRNVHNFVQLSHERTAGAVFEEEVGVLAHFAHGLSGRKLKLAEADITYTDTETIYLPPLLARLPTPQQNFLLYKAFVALLWAQTRFGTFRAKLSDQLQQHSEPENFLALFQSLETLRLEACLARELPGLFRDMQTLKTSLAQNDLPAAYLPLAKQLSQPDTTAADVLRLTCEHFGKLQPLPPLCYQTNLQIEEVEACMAKRIETEKARMRVNLAKMLEEMQKENRAFEQREHKFDIKKQPDPTAPEGFQIELTLDDQPIAPPEEVRALSNSIIQDLGDIPDEYLVPAGDGEYDPRLFEDNKPDPDDVWSGTYHEEGAFLYNEWDYRRQHYRKNWCAVREVKITPVYDDFVNSTLHKYSGLVKHLRKTFEAMRDEDRLLKRQVYGDGVDIDALVEALADSHDGSEMSDRLFTRMHRVERNIAVVFMVDMSGSTKGWINEAERESLILLAETLETLGDRYAIYGFSGMARKRCEIYRIKEFDEPYNDEIKARISGIEPKDYTRMGFAIRHLSHILNEVEARTRILITLSDGKPDDYDNYRGDYGIEDTRRALLEARRDGIHPYCITIDREARDYLPHLYGPAAYTVINEVRQLPLKVSDIYRRLTT
ncbi:MAG: nitric oxide reductase activation protein [Gammaproteobacteria bacterium]|nr:nitric oxide reductase activation protein [Gammaproteobacteria bacterium]